ncbi:fimbrial protein [Providencia burhodogranariea]|uniref:Fimbrial subunit n=1 Tax=Providencia burhodogranariea DSM 19968 TaxID=1141662 RepID=K8W445_9GAMM|nr:fimbrial protein [Providencia burhodogranariea]EKT55338.1 fimbrial subunit [Providencia burhodogranariea DSM 19968]
MKIINQLNRSCLLLFLLQPLFSYADVLLDVTATMIEPTCDIRSENNSSPLKISFGTLNIDDVNKSKAVNNFPLYITGCNLNKNLAIILSPKGMGTLLYNGKKILATSISGLGIDFNEVTGGNVRSLDVSKKQRIYPENISSSQSKIDLQAKLVSTVPVNQLEAGKFTSTMTIAVTYY